MASFIVNVDQSKREVKNLGWLNRNWRAVSSFNFEYAPQGASNDGRLIAHLRDGRRYETDFASLSVCFNWLRRPIFKGLPLTIYDGLNGKVLSTWTIGDANYTTYNRMEWAAQRATLLGK